MAATAGNFRPLATSSDTSEKNLARQPRLLAPTAALNSQELRRETAIFYTTSASSDETLRELLLSIKLRIESGILFAITYEEGSDAKSLPVLRSCHFILDEWAVSVVTAMIRGHIVGGEVSRLRLFNLCFLFF